MSKATVIPPSPPNVALLVDMDVYVRLGSIVRHICVGMMDEGVRLTVIARAEKYPSGESIGPSRVICFPQHRLPWRRTTPDAIREAIGARPDIVHTLSTELMSWARPFAAEWNSVLLTHVTDPDEIRRLGKMPLQMPAHVVATTDALHHRITTLAPQMANRVHTIPLGMPCEKEPACLARPERVPAVVVTVPLVRRCGVETVLLAMRDIVNQGQEAQLFVLADGPMLWALRRQAEQLELRPYVTFAGRMSDWGAQREAMRGGDFLIIPSGGERYSISTMTAMAAGLAVIAPTTTEAPYLIDGQTASLYPPDKPDGLRDCWKALLDDHTRARRLAHGGLDYIRSHHQASAMVTALGKLYRELNEARLASAATTTATVS